MEKKCVRIVAQTLYDSFLFFNEKKSHFVRSVLAMYTCKLRFRLVDAYLIPPRLVS